MISRALRLMKDLSVAEIGNVQADPDWMLSFQHGELLPENHIFQEKTAARMETAESSCQKEPNCAKHWVVLSQKHCEFQ